MVLAPLLLLGALELALRLAGYGYATSFFVRAEAGGQSFLHPNSRFGWRFFPRTQARAPLPARLTERKPAGTFRIFVLGESAAQGDPDPTYGVGRYLEILLRQRYPGARFEVVGAAMTAINSHALLPIARECARLEPDLFVIYMGNNEMVGPFGAGTVFGPQAPPLPVIRASLALKSTRCGQLGEAFLGRWGAKVQEAKSWGGMQMFTGHQVSPEAPARLRVYEHFARNLEDILRVARRCEAPVILSTVACNLADCAPFGSLHREGLEAGPRATWDELFQIGAARQAEGKFAEALDLFAKAAALDPGYADLQFRLATCQRALSNLPSARSAFVLARDADTLAFRADTRINTVVREAGRRHAGQGVRLVDAEEALAREAGAGLPGQDLFYEHVHLTFRGNYLLAREFANQVAELLPAALRAGDRGTWADEAACEARLGITAWDRQRLWDINCRRLRQAPFTGQSNHAQALRESMAQLAAARRAFEAEPVERGSEIYGRAVEQAPEDYYLRENFAEYLENSGVFAEALEQQRRLEALLPWEPSPAYRAGRILLRLGKRDEAVASVARSLSLNPEFLPALNEMALLLAHQRKPEEAAVFFERALRVNPARAETWLNRGFMQQAEGQLSQAMASYGEAARLEPGGAAALFEQAVSLAAGKHRKEAIQSFTEAIRFKAGFWQAAYLLGNELAAQGEVEPARAQFEEVALRRPDFAKGRLNLGVALARQGQLEAAAAEFRATLTLDPTNHLAQQHLQTIEGMKARTGK